MNGSYINEKELKKARRKAWFREKFQSAKDWVVDNKEFLAIATPAAVAVTGKVVKTAVKRNNLHKEKLLKENYCYDRSLGHYWKLRRELTNDEWIEIDRRKKGGERLADILDSLRVLK